MGSGNIGIGNSAGNAMINGTSNIAIGMLSQMDNESGIGNVTIGSSSGNMLTDAFGNTAIGDAALSTNTSGDGNIALGFFAMGQAPSPNQNIGIGNRALLQSNATSNIAIGDSSMIDNTSGYNNIAIGHNALEDNVFGIENIAIGNNANTAIPNLINTIGIGHDSDPTSDNEIVIGNLSHTSIGGYANWSNISDARFKININENVPGLKFITALRPVTYNVDNTKIEEWFLKKYGKVSNTSKDRITSLSHTGFLAQDVHKVAKSLDYEFSGVDCPQSENDFYKLRYAEFVVPLVQAVKEQQEMIEILINRIEQLENK